MPMKQNVLDYPGLAGYTSLKETVDRNIKLIWYIIVSIIRFIYATECIVVVKTYTH